MKQEDVQEFYTYIQSEQTARNFLHHSYQNMGIDNPKVKSYENCNSFLHYLKHGLHFYEAGKQLTTTVQPVMFFYGMIHLIKATLLLKRPNYPESTKLLAHGVSSRKLKRRNYTFMEDEVTVHSNGLYTYFSDHLYQIKTSAMKKFNMKELLTLIPEMSKLIQFDNGSTMSVVGNLDVDLLTFNKKLLDDYHLTARAFIERMTTYLPKVIHTDMGKDYIQIKLSDPLSNPAGPFFLHMANGTIHLPTNRKFLFPISEVMVHYLLLYNLSMISRYETEWWGDLLTTHEAIDFPFIKKFLHVTADKVPFFLGYRMHQDFLTYKGI